MTRWSFLHHPSSLRKLTKPSGEREWAHCHNFKGRTVAKRFNYDYTKPELQQIKRRVDEGVEKEAPEEIHIVANNNRSGFAPRTAARDYGTGLQRTHGKWAFVPLTVSALALGQNRSGREAVSRSWKPGAI
jgi:uncharacterized protein YecE (DUF72 family)